MSNLPALLLDARNTEVSLSSNFLETLTTKEEYEAAFSIVSEQKNTMIWWEADLVLDYYKRFHQEHLNVYKAGQLMNNSTIKFYLRTAAAFPPDTRIPAVSFSHHYQASFADEWNAKTLSFAGERRFPYLHRASDEELSTRKLKEVIDVDNHKKAKNQEELGCIHCVRGGPVELYTIYKSGLPKMNPLRIFLHDDCFQETKNFMIQNHDLDVI